MPNRFPFFDLTRQYQNLKPEIMAAVERVFDKQEFVMGSEVSGLETELAAMLGVKHAITCGSGTDALVLALKSLDLQPGDEVLTPAFSFFASTSCILLAGLTPVFVDIDPKTFNMDPKSLTRFLTPKTKAVMPVHLFGQCAEMDPILEFSRKNNLKVVEDGAQSILAQYNGRQACSMGDVGAISFYPTKNLGGAGEGGLVTTQSDGVAEKLRLLRVHGMRVRYTHDILGWNSRMDALQCAVVRVKLPHLNSWVKRRTDLARRYGSELAPLEKRGLLVTPKVEDGRFPVWNQYTILVHQRDHVRRSLDERGIPTDIFYPKTIPAQPVLQKMGYTENSYPVAVDCAKKALSLPIFPELKDEEQAWVIEALGEVLNKVRGEEFGVEAAHLI